MSSVSLWFERKFEFEIPAERFPNLLIRLRGTPARLEEIVRAAAANVLVRRPAPDKWSAQEHAGHLLDLEPLWTARIGDYASGAAVLTAADLRNQKTEQANHNARPLDNILREFREARSALLDRAESVDLSAHSCGIVHPRLNKPMRLTDHLHFVAEHDDHHLARIWELIGR